MTIEYKYYAGDLRFDELTLNELEMMFGDLLDIETITKEVDHE